MKYGLLFDTDEGVEVEYLRSKISLNLLAGSRDSLDLIRGIYEFQGSEILNSSLQYIIDYKF